MNWAQRIEAAELSGTFTADDVRMANYWDSCLLSEYPDMPRVSAAWLAPMDGQLRSLGNEFSQAVIDDEFAVAKGISQRVRDRYVELYAPEKRMP